MYKNFKKNKYSSGPASTQGGITLIELLVVIFIFMVITGITIFNYGKFNSSLSIQNLADDIALSVRRAQGYAIGVRGFSSSFIKGYGIHFTTNPDTSDLSAGSNKSFILFSDINITTPNKYNYDGTNICGPLSMANECLEVLNITSADQITQISLNDGDTTIPQTGTLDILFKRPNPEPIFCYRSDISHSDCDLGGSNISSVKIKISNITNLESSKMITISNNGQISVSNN